MSSSAPAPGSPSPKRDCTGAPGGGGGGDRRRRRGSSSASSCSFSSSHSAYSSSSSSRRSSVCSSHEDENDDGRDDDGDICKSGDEHDDSSSPAGRAEHRRRRSHAQSRREKSTPADGGRGSEVDNVDKFLLVGLIGSALSLVVAIAFKLHLLRSRPSYGVGGGALSRKTITTTTANAANSAAALGDVDDVLYDDGVDLGPVPEIGPPVIYTIGLDGVQAGRGDGMMVTDEMRLAFDVDGVVAVRGLIPDELLGRLDEASGKLVRDRTERLIASGMTTMGGGGASKGPGGAGGRQFHTTKVGAFLLDPPPPTSCAARDRNETGDDSSCVGDGGGGRTTDSKRIGMSTMSAFRDVAVHSLLPAFAAQLMRLDVDADVDESKRETTTSSSFSEGTGEERASGDNATTLRMLRDVFLAKDADEYICGWHVDDWGFWPADPTSPGVNAWIALDDMPPEHGGGFALAVGSHRATWRDAAHRATGATTTYPPGGFDSAEDMFRRRTGGGTCNLHRTAPRIHRRMEETMRVYDMRRGDVIFHTRWLFHRTVAFERDYVRGGGPTPAAPVGQSERRLLYRRYSVRYAPGTARLPRGYAMEPSILWDESNAGRTIDDVAARHGPWYPRCWPSPSETELSKMGELVRDKLPVAEARQKERKREMQPFLQEMGRQQAQQQKQKSLGQSASMHGRRKY